jgi:hypothetical protein
MTAFPHIHPMGENYKASHLRKTTMQSHGHPVCPALFMSVSVAIADPLLLRVTREQP